MYAAPFHLSVVCTVAMWRCISSIFALSGFGVDCCCTPLGGALDPRQCIFDTAVDLPIHGVFDEPPSPSRQEGEVSAKLQPGGVFGDGRAGNVIVNGDSKR